MLCAALGSVFLAAAAYAQQELDITKEVTGGWPPPVPISISGFTGEVDAVLKQDIVFMGMENVTPAKAKFLVTGNNASRVEGRVIDKFDNKMKLAPKGYTGGTLRAQAHAFADDVALAITGKPGIAQTKIAFKVESGPRLSEVYVADYDGFNARQVTPDHSAVAAPTWASRTMLLYASYKLGPVYVYSHDLPTGARRAVARYPGMNSSPAVSPDGRRVALILSKNGNPDLFVSDLEGGNLKQLTTTREAESSPCWSSDGQTICFVSRERGPAALYTVLATGGAMRRLPTVGAPSPTEPDWSPDGKWIAFTSLTRDFSICIVPAQGGNAIFVTEGEDPSWAPNSRALIFCKGHDHAKSMYLLDVPTKRVKSIGRILESNSQPSWARQK
jgi:TolB protein